MWALLPGALIVGLGVGLLQILTITYVVHVVTRKSALYGAIGIALALLLWTYFAGRLLTAATAANASLWKHRIGEEAGHGDLAESLERLNLEELYRDLEQLEQRLTAIEEKMIARARSMASEEALFEARRSLDQELKPYRGKMSAEQLATLERQFLDRKVIEAAGLPRLSLFYLAV